MFHCFTELAHLVSKPSIQAKYPDHHAVYNVYGYTSTVALVVDVFSWIQPERILGGEYGIHSEIWSLGVSILEVGG